MQAKGGSPSLRALPYNDEAVHYRRHARAWRGHPRLTFVQPKGVDGRTKSGNDGNNRLTIMPAFAGPRPAMANTPFRHCERSEAISRRQSRAGTAHLQTRGSGNPGPHHHRLPRVPAFAGTTQVDCLGEIRSRVIPLASPCRSAIVAGA